MPKRSPCAALVRQYDTERYYAGLFVPAHLREHFYSLCAFNYEIAKIGETVSEEMTGLIRLQWWRDLLPELYAGKTRNHDVVAGMGALIQECQPDIALFEGMLDARELDMDAVPFLNESDLLHYARIACGSVFQVALQIMGEQDKTLQQAAEHLGVAWGVTGLLRALPYRLSRGKCPLPQSLLQQYEVEVDSLFTGEEVPRLARVFDDMVRMAEAELAACKKLLGKPSRATIAVFLPAALIPKHLQAIRKKGAKLVKEPVLHHPLLTLMRLYRAAIKGKI